MYTSEKQNKTKSIQMQTPGIYGGLGNPYVYHLGASSQEFLIH